MRSLELQIDVTDAAGLGEKATVALTVHLPDPATMPARPVVCVAKPGGGYSRGYYTEDLPGPARGAQAAWHAARGWIVVSIDHLGVGASSTHHDPLRLTYTPLVAANHAAEREVLRRLADASLADGFPAVTDPVLLGIGQSMGGCLTVVQQGRYHCYDGIAVLGYSAVHTHPPVAPGAAPVPAPWIPRDVGLTDGTVLNAPALAELAAAAAPDATTADPAARTLAMGWGFHYDDVDAAIVRADLTDFPTRAGQLPAWASATVPGTVAVWCLTPGAIAPEAAAVTSPVLIAMGERDVVADPYGEPRAYRSARSIDLYICPRMGHMHNFAGTRELFWQRLHSWAGWVATTTTTTTTATATTTTAATV